MGGPWEEFAVRTRGPWVTAADGQVTGDFETYRPALRSTLSRFEKVIRGILGDVEERPRFFKCLVAIGASRVSNGGWPSIGHVSPLDFEISVVGPQPPFRSLREIRRRQVEIHSGCVHAQKPAAGSAAGRSDTSRGSPGTCGQRARCRRQPSPVFLLLEKRPVHWLLLLCLHCG